MPNNISAIFTKIARPMGLDAVPQGGGSDQIANALNLLEQARALARPSDAILKKNRINRSELANVAGELASDSGDKYDLASRKADPKQRALIGGIAGGVGVPLMGLLAGARNPMGLIGSGVVAGGLGAGGGYFSGTERNRQLLGTAKVLKDYGLLKPELLRRALPLLKQSSYPAYPALEKMAFSESARIAPVTAFWPGDVRGRAQWPPREDADNAVGAATGAKAGIAAAKDHTATDWHGRNPNYKETKTPQEFEEMRKLKDMTAAYVRSQSNGK